MKKLHDEAAELIRQAKVSHDNAVSLYNTRKSARTDGDNKILLNKAAYEGANSVYDARKAARDGGDAAIATALSEHNDAKTLETTNKGKQIAAAAKVNLAAAAKQTAINNIALRGTIIPGETNAVPTEVQMILSERHTAVGSIHLTHPLALKGNEAGGVYTCKISIDKAHLNELYDNNLIDMASVKLAVKIYASGTDNGALGLKVLATSKTFYKSLTPGADTTDKLKLLEGPSKPTNITLVAVDEGFKFSLKMKASAPLKTGQVPYKIGGVPTAGPDGPLIAWSINPHAAGGVTQTTDDETKDIHIVFASTKIDASSIGSDGLTEYTLSGNLDNHSTTKQPWKHLPFPDKLFENEHKYEVSCYGVSVIAGNKVNGKMSGGKVVEPTNRPAQLVVPASSIGSSTAVRTNIIKTQSGFAWGRDQTKAGGELDLNTAIAAYATLEYSDLHVGNPDTCRVVWGVVADGQTDIDTASGRASRSNEKFEGNDADWKPRAEGQVFNAKCKRDGATVSAAEANKPPLGAVGSLKGKQTLLLEIPLKWFEKPAAVGGFHQWIMIQAFVTQRSVAAGAAVPPLQGDLMMNAQAQKTALRVNLAGKDGLVKVASSGGNAGPLLKGIDCLEAGKDDGNQLFRFKGGKLINSDVTASWTLPQKNNEHGQAVTAAGSVMTVTGDKVNPDPAKSEPVSDMFTATTVAAQGQAVPYAKLVDKNGELTFKATAFDPNGSYEPTKIDGVWPNLTFASVNGVAKKYQYVLEQSCKVHGFKKATGNLTGAIERGDKAGDAPGVSVNASGIDTNGFQLSKARITVKQDSIWKAGDDADKALFVQDKPFPKNAQDVVQAIIPKFTATANQTGLQYSPTVSYGMYQLSANVLLSFDFLHDDVKKLYEVAGGTLFLSAAKGLSENAGTGMGIVAAQKSLDGKPVFFNGPTITSAYMKTTNSATGAVLAIKDRKMVVKGSTNGSLVAKEDYLSIGFEMKDEGASVSMRTGAVWGNVSQQQTMAALAKLKPGEVQGRPDIKKHPNGVIDRSVIWDFEFHIDGPGTGWLLDGAGDADLSAQSLMARSGYTQFDGLVHVDTAEKAKSALGLIWRSSEAARNPTTMPN